MQPLPCSSERTIPGKQNKTKKHQDESTRRGVSHFLPTTQTRRRKRKNKTEM
jgi:hypothetical protein